MDDFPHRDTVRVRRRKREAKARACLSIGGGGGPLDTAMVVVGAAAVTGCGRPAAVAAVVVVRM